MVSEMVSEMVSDVPSRIVSGVVSGTFALFFSRIISLSSNLAFKGSVSTVSERKSIISFLSSSHFLFSCLVQGSGTVSILLYAAIVP